MKKEPDEFVQADKATGKSWLILFFVYVLLLIWLEPLIDTLLSLNPPDKELAAIQVFNEKKVYIATLAFGIARSLPILLFYGWRIGFYCQGVYHLKTSKFRLQ